MLFDLNLNNYSIKEIEEIFDLSTYPTYDTTLLDEKTDRLTFFVNQHPTLQDSIRKSTIVFIQNAKSRLQDPKYNAKFNPGQYHQIIYKPPTNQYITHQTEFPTGNLNPIQKSTTQIVVNIDTRFRSNYFSTHPVDVATKFRNSFFSKYGASDFHFNLPDPLNNIASIQLTALEFPAGHNFFRISSSLRNHCFKITVQYNYLGQHPTHSLFVTLPDGTYNQDVDNIFNDIRSQLDIAGLTHYPYSYIRFVKNVNETTGIGTFQTRVYLTDTMQNLQIDSITIDFVEPETPGLEKLPLYQRLGWILGFRAETLQFKNESSSFVSDALYDVQGPRYAYLAIDTMRNNVDQNFIIPFYSSILSKNIIARIPLTPIGAAIPHQYTSSTGIPGFLSEPRKFFGPVDIQKLHVQLLNEFGQILELQNMDYSFCLTCTKLNE